MACLSAWLSRAAFAAALSVFASAVQAKPEYCAFLAPEDFKAAGIVGAAKPSYNPDQVGAYCVYAGKSSALGGIEFDIFVASSVREADEIWANVRPASTKRESVAKALPPADKAELAGESGPYKFTALGVKRGRVVFHVGVPNAPGSREAVLALAKLVLKRTGHLGR